MADNRALLKNTGREHDAVSLAIQVLEKALVSPAPGREAAWKQRAGAALASVEDLVRQHVESAEGDGGIFEQIETALGRPRDLTLARNEHERLRRASHALLTELDERAEAPSFAPEEVRERTLRLISVFRRHQAREADLLFLAFGQDIGTGD
jgi:hemerythrin-like domain-containing protein